MRDHKNSILSATSAAKILCKMLDYQKNRHADVVTKVLCENEPEFIVLFNIETLLDYECSSAIMMIYKIYIENRLISDVAEDTIQ
jgi:hypothetical protein